MQIDVSDIVEDTEDCRKPWSILDCRRQQYDTDAGEEEMWIDLKEGGRNRP